MEAITSFAKCLAGPLNAFCAFCCTAFGHVMACEDNMESLKKKMLDLQCCIDNLQTKIDEAAREGKTARSEVKLWQKNVENLQGEASRMENKFREMSRCLGDCSPNVWYSYKLSTRAIKMIADANDLKKNIPQEIAIKLAPNSYVQRPGGTMVGRDSEFKRLQQLSGDDEVSTIGIYGMGRVGKTELLNKFYNQPHLKHTHDMIWIDMNGCRSVEDTQRAIAERLELCWNENENQEARAHRISQYLNMKSYILIMDSIWKEVDLKDVGVPSTRQTKSKVILTTRVEGICNRMGAAKTKIHVKCLEEKEAWSLFKGEVGEELIKSNSMTEHLAKVLVDKCGGLPPALVAVGQAMAGKETPRTWAHAIDLLDSAPQEILGTDILTSLKLSFDKLADSFVGNDKLADKMRTCLLYFLLLPDNIKIYKEWIIDYCIGEGIIDDVLYHGDQIYNDGHYLIDILKSASLLESSDDDVNVVTMHPVIRAMALWIACECGKEEKKWLVRIKKQLKQQPDAEKWRGAERISLARNNITMLSKIPECPSLLTLLMAENQGLEKICDGFLRSMRNLRVLDLSNTSIEEVPAEIGELLELRYLDFYKTKIHSLPQQLGNLVNLRFLLLSHTPNLTSIPKGLIKKLSELRVLRMYHSYNDWKVESVGEGLEFDELQSLERLKALGVSVKTVLALEKLAQSNPIADSIRYLEISLSPGLTKISTACLRRDYKALKDLRVYRCSDLEELEIDDDDDDDDDYKLSSFQNLTELFLVELPRVKLTWKRGGLENLDYIHIDSCQGMKQLIHCEAEDDEEEESSSEINVLPVLTELSLFNLPELESLRCGRRTLAFPSLNVLHIRNCPKLKRLPLNAGKLSCIRGSKAWWKNLELPEDDNIRTKLGSIFKEDKEKSPKQWYIA